MFTFASHVNK